MTAPASSEPSGLTVDGIRVPQTVEAEGAEAVEAYVAAHRGDGSAAVVDTAPASPANPPTLAEGAE
jgi:hypothetical protein